MISARAAHQFFDTQVRRIKSVANFSEYYSTATWYRVFSRDVTAANLVSLNKGTAAMLVSQSNPPGIELYSYANVFFCFG